MPRHSTSPKGSGGNVAGKVDGTIGVGKTFDVQDWCPCINFASDSYANSDLVFEGGQSRRPGGSFRGPGTWHVRTSVAPNDEPIFGLNGCPGKSEFDS